MNVSSLLAFGSRQAIPLPASDEIALADLRSRYATALSASSANHHVVWLGAAPTQAPWSDWAHQIVRQLDQRKANPSLVTAWTHAATTAPPDTQWLVWQEVVEELARTTPRPILQAFTPPLAGDNASSQRLDSERVVFLEAWARLLDYTLHEVQPATPVPGPANAEASAATTTTGTGDTALRDEKAKEYIAELASVLQEHGVRRTSARRLASVYLACRPVAPLDPDLVDHFLKEVVAPAPPFYLRLTKAPSSEPYPITPNDADERGRWNVRLAFLRLLATLEPACVITMCKTRSGFRELYGWQGVAGPGAKARHAFIDVCLHSQLPLEPIVPRFGGDGLAHNFWCRFRVPLLKAIHTLVEATDAAVEPPEDYTLTKALIDCFGGAKSSYVADPAAIYERIQSCESATNGQRRRALILLGDLCAGRGPVADTCWNQLEDPANGVPDLDALAAEIMLGKLGEARFAQALKREDFSADEKARLQFRRWVMSGNHEALAKLGAVRTLHLPDDIARCIYAWCATDYLPGSTAAQLPERRRDVFRIIAIEGLIRYRQTFQMDIYRPEVEPEVAPLVFISYRNASKSAGGGWETSQHLIELLKHSRYKVYQDRRIAGGADWSEDILSKLFSARVVVALHSAGYDQSPWCRLERRIASLKQDQGAQIGIYIPVHLDTYQPTHHPSDPPGERARFTQVHAHTDAHGRFVEPAKVGEAIADAIQLRSGKGKALYDADQHLEESLIATPAARIAEPD